MSTPPGSPPAVSRGGDALSDSHRELDRLTRTAWRGPTNEKMPAWFAQHVAPDFRADFDGVQGYQSWEDHLETFRRILAANPDYRPVLSEVVINVDEANGRAEAYCHVHNSGRVQNLQMQTMGVLTWVRSAGRWRLWRIKTIRGSDCFF